MKRSVRTKPRVLVAMSGGVDSSVAAALLVRAGYDVIGCFMRLGSPGEAIDEPGDADRGEARIGKQGCCSIHDAADARLVAAELGIPFYVCNFKRQFGRIIDYFVREYARGRTPNPCVRCNDWLKFGTLHEYARTIGAELVASGHYARIEPGPHGAPQLRRGIDAHKDQSYVLFGSPRERLGEMLLPIGRYNKVRVRELARELGLPVFDKPDSQEICFVPDGDYARLVEARAPELRVRGEILSTDGAILGEHDGQHRYTIGQRRGLGVALGEPAYVVSKDPTRNTVTVGARPQLRSAGCVAGEANWLVDARPFERWRSCLIKHRYNGAATPGRVRTIEPIAAPTPSGRTEAFEVRFDQPQEAVTPGQAVAIYDASDPDLVLGGGWIARTVEERAHGRDPGDACSAPREAISR